MQSDLRGLASGLPEPFAKTADSARPLTLEASFDGTAGPRIEGSFGRDVHALLQWRAKPSEPPIERGLILFGGATPVALPQSAGLWLAGRLETASLTRLLDLKWQEPRGRPIQDYLGGADLSVGRFDALGYVFTEVSGRLRPGNSAWEVDVASSAAAGHVSVPFTFPGEVPLVLDLERLRFGERDAAAGKRPDPDPRNLPAIRAQLGEFVFDERNYGRVEAEFARGTAGITLNRFVMKHPAFTAQGRGSWLVRGESAECRLAFEADTGDVKGLMGAMRLGTQVEGEKGRVIADLNWPGPPEVSAIGRLNGRLEISAKNGNLTAVEKRCTHLKIQHDISPKITITLLHMHGPLIRGGLSFYRALRIKMHIMQTQTMIHADHGERMEGLEGATTVRGFIPLGVLLNALLMDHRKVAIGFTQKKSSKNSMPIIGSGGVNRATTILLLNAFFQT